MRTISAILVSGAIGFLTGCSEGEIKECTKHFLPGESGYPRNVELTRKYLRENKEQTLMEYLHYISECEDILRDAGINITVNKKAS